MYIHTYVCDMMIMKKIFFYKCNKVQHDHTSGDISGKKKFAIFFFGDLELVKVLQIDGTCVHCTSSGLFLGGRPRWSNGFTLCSWYSLRSHCKNGLVIWNMLLPGLYFCFHHCRGRKWSDHDTFGSCSIAMSRS